MMQQNALFPEMEETSTESQPHGFRYRDEIITEAQQTALLESLRQLELKPFEFHGHLGNRRVVSFGLKYDYSRRSVEPAIQMPAFLNDLLQRVADFAGADPNAFRQVGVNEYRPGAGIGWHKDKQEFGIIVGVSLLASATMRFRRANGAGWKRVSRTVKPRSIYILAGEARTQWEHSIPPLRDLALLDYLPHSVDALAQLNRSLCYAKSAPKLFRSSRGHPSTISLSAGPHSFPLRNKGKHVILPMKS